MKRLPQAPLISVLSVAVVLLFLPALTAAQDATTPTANYTPPPAATGAGPAPGAVHSLGTLAPSDVAPGSMPSATPVHSTPMSSPTLAVLSDVPQPQTVGSITYVTGGVGEEERGALQATKKEYNLYVMVADKTGHFLADTQIIIHDPKGGEVLNATAGPIFYAKLPAGSYTVEAVNQGQSKKQNIVIHGSEASHAFFSW